MATTMSAQRVLNPTNYDVNKDGQVSLEDVTCIVNALLGKVNIPITNISMSSKLLLAVGDDESVALQPTIMPTDADYLTLFWTSSNERVAMVDQTGRVTGIGEGECIITASAMDGSGMSAMCTVNVVSQMYVDLGLPSGTLWAICNVGANKPEEQGGYFAWGETIPYGEEDRSNTRNYLYCGSYTKTYYSNATYKWYDGTDILSGAGYTKYCSDSNYGYNGFTDNLEELELEDDAAYVNWGSKWRMPDYNQMQELFNSAYTTVSKPLYKNGVLITSRTNGNSIYLPFSGYCDGARFDYLGTQGYYWSRTLKASYNAGSMYISGSGGYGNTRYVRSIGYSIRPVRNQ